MKNKAAFASHTINDLSHSLNSYGTNKICMPHSICAIKIEEMLRKLDVCSHKTTQNIDRMIHSVDDFFLSVVCLFF